MARYIFNDKYFDNIITPEQAYWLGFVWCDGYVCRRKRGKYTSYETKIALAVKDIEHVKKLKNALQSNHRIHVYRVTNSNTKEARLLLCNKHLGKILFEKYGMVPFRTDFSKVLHHVRPDLRRFLLRGIFDADGCIACRDVNYSGVNRKEFSVSLTAIPAILDFFNNIVNRSNITDTKYARIKRHELSETPVRTIYITGNIVVTKFLRWLYGNKPDLSLARKYKRFKAIDRYMTEYQKERGGFSNENTSNSLRSLTA